MFSHWIKLGGEIKNLEIIQNCYAIYQRIKDKLTLTHVAGHAGTEGNELTDRMPVLGAQSKEKGTTAVPADNGYSDAAQDAGGVIEKALGRTMPSAL